MDLATIAWLGLWVTLGIRLYAGLAELAGAGRLIRDGGFGIRDSGEEVAGVLQGIPLVGKGPSPACAAPSAPPPTP